MRIWAKVAEVGRTKTLTGGLVVHGIDGLPFLLSEGREVAFVPPRLEAPRRAKPVSITQLKDASFLVHFDKVQDIDAAKALTGSICLVRRSELPPDFDKEKIHSLSGAEVVDVHWGELGRVTDYLDHGVQALFEVEGSYGKILIPDVSEFIESFDSDRNCLQTKIPRGVLELAVQPKKRVEL